MEKFCLNSETLNLFLIFAGVSVVVYLLYRYYNNSGEEYVDVDREGFEGENTMSPSGMNDPNKQLSEEELEYINSNQQNNTAMMNQQNNTGMMNQQNNTGMMNQQNNMTGQQQEVLPAEAWGMNERPRGLNTDNGVSPDQVPNECYPKDTLTSSDLLPTDSNSVWAQVNPLGQGSLGDDNLLNSGYHIGVNTVGQTLRNPNYQLRSEPPNPQVQVSPWMQSTMEPDLNRRPMEIGGSN